MTGSDLASEANRRTAAERARKTGESTFTFSITLTANAMAGDDRPCLAAEMNGYLTKPIKKERLRETLARFLKAILGRVT